MSCLNDNLCDNLCVCVMLINILWVMIMFLIMTAVSFYYYYYFVVFTANMEYKSQCNATQNAVCRCKAGYRCNDQSCTKCETDTTALPASTTSKPRLLPYRPVEIVRNVLSTLCISDTFTQVKPGFLCTQYAPLISTFKSISTLNTNGKHCKTIHTWCVHIVTFSSLCFYSKQVTPVTYTSSIHYR